ncbi:MAG: hypothetical protein EHM42_10705, partial [Planctomycetaceae bacterium]
MGPAFLRKYNTLLVAATAIQIPIIKRGVVDFAVSADWTPAAGDVKISKDGGAAANVTNLPTAVTMGNTAYWEFVLTAAELSCQQAVITVADAATKAVEDQSFLVETYGHASARYPADWSDGVRFGLTALPNVAAGADGGLPLGDANSRVDVGKWLGTTQSSTLFSGITSLANWLRLAIRLGYTDATALGEINTGGTGAFAPATESLEYIAGNLSGGAGNWTSLEKEQIRNRIGIDGTGSVPSVTPTLALETSVQARLPTVSYVAPDNASIFTILTRTDVATSTRAAAVDYTSVRAAKLDNLDATITSRAAASVFSGITSLANWLRLALRLGYTDATALGEINTGGTGAFAPATESLEAIAAAGGGGGGGGDPLTNRVPGSYAAGTAGEALGRIGTGTINVVTPLSA